MLQTPVISELEISAPTYKATMVFIFFISCLQLNLPAFAAYNSSSDRSAKPCLQVPCAAGIQFPCIASHLQAFSPDGMTATPERSHLPQHRKQDISLLRNTELCPPAAILAA